MIRTALGMTGVFLLLHLLGGRDCVGLLSGTMEGGNTRLAFGILYTLSWFSAVLLVPVLLLAGLADLALLRLRRTRSC
ncbi:hypothetical protein [Vitiosangium sp. GDMCC 1.1324]|uniref:hypothetical protein n=1 Tax=Vitiosangium sp. (strain GDMCC 1.1324) TaxID=2138576 RepID=UPI000D35F74E|nr:hypothetical protein [Vitiosangium sp. GDMCC 1.1324]PTL79742.1 hypothetical protein DAT35_33630 [Vitiosangium sp. GDMCC 1.1324]